VQVVRQLSPGAEPGTVRLAELVASLSFATDLGRGLPMEHSIRRARIALRLADLVGAADDDRIATYYTGLLDGVYCHADADEQAMWFGDDIAVKTDTYEVDGESLRGLFYLLRRLGAGGGGPAPRLGAGQPLAGHPLEPPGAVRGPHRTPGRGPRVAAAIV
jgi:hypothetical protein